MEPLAPEPRADDVLAYLYDDIQDDTDPDTIRHKVRWLLGVLQDDRHHILQARLGKIPPPRRPSGREGNGAVRLDAVGALRADQL